MAYAIFGGSGELSSASGQAPSRRLLRNAILCHIRATMLRLHRSRIGAFNRKAKDVTIIGRVVYLGSRVDFRDFGFPTIGEAIAALVQKALTRAENNQRVAALLLWITPQALNQRLKRQTP